MTIDRECLSNRVFSKIQNLKPRWKFKEDEGREGEAITKINCNKILWLKYHQIWCCRCHQISYKNTKNKLQRLCDFIRKEISCNQNRKKMN